MKRDNTLTKYNYYILISCFLLNTTFLFSQNRFQVRGFGHIENETEYHHADNEYHNSWLLGEQSVFVTGAMSNKFSFLGEFAINYSMAGNHGVGSSFQTTVRRARVKYNYKGNHSIIAGQMHTVINYWNDTYYHARIFFPTADRPLAFTYFIPIHSLGLRAQGQNLGKLNFGYDLQLGNSLEGDGLNPATLAAIHFKPIDGTRISISYFYNFIYQNMNMQHMHEEKHLMTSNYKGSLDFHLTSFSFARFEKRLEILDEFSSLITKTDSLGQAYSFSNYLYIGYNIKDKHTPFVLLDLIRSADNDLRNGAFNQIKIGVGLKHEFTSSLSARVQLERYTSISNWNNGLANNKNEFTVQFSYAMY